MLVPIIGGIIVALLIGGSAFLCYQVSASAPAFRPVVKADAGGPPGPSVL